MRIKEVFECFRLLGQTATTLSPRVSTVAAKFMAQFLPAAGVLNSRSKFTGMEELISHFRLFSEGSAPAAGLTYGCVESPKGELGVLLVSSGTVRPHRVKVRTPVSHNMHLIPSVCAGFVFGDFVMTFCSLDIVLGEIDR